MKFLVLALLIGIAGATSFADMDSMARMEQAMVHEGYDVVASWMTEMNGEDVYMFAMNNNTDSSAVPVQALVDAAGFFSAAVNNGFSADGMAVLCAFNDGYYGSWYVSRESAIAAWSGRMPLDAYYDEVLESYSVAVADF